MIPRYYLIKILQLTVLLSFSSNVLAAESIATVKQVHSRLNNEPGNYDVDLLAIATLSNVTINGFKVSELSGLAWDEDEKILYALSDNGYVLHLNPVLVDEQLTDVEFIAGFALLDNKNRPLKYKAADSEGLAIINSNNHTKNDTELIISFERIPRLIKYKPDGTQISEIKLPGLLSDIKNYRSENKSLEAVTVHSKRGIMVGTEAPLLGQNSALMSIYSIDGSSWSFPFQNEFRGALVDMTTMQDGDILVLERAYGGLFQNMDITLHRFSPDNKQDQTEIIFNFSQNNDLFNENFEGISHFRENKYFMISDDNNHPLKTTQLILFSITKIK